MRVSRELTGCWLRDWSVLKTSFPPFVPVLFSSIKGFSSLSFFFFFSSQHWENPDLLYFIWALASAPQTCVLKPYQQRTSNPCSMRAFRDSPLDIFITIRKKKEVLGFFSFLAQWLFLVIFISDLSNEGSVAFQCKCRTWQLRCHYRFAVKPEGF